MLQQTAFKENGQTSILFVLLDYKIDAILSSDSKYGPFVSKQSI